MISFCDKLKVATKNLTIGLKNGYLPILLKRDNGFVCFYCGCELEIDAFLYEHLDNDRNHNEIENIVLACIPCNNKKPSNKEMCEKAIKKLKENENSNFMSERKISGKIHTQEASTEIEINVSNFDIVYQFISEVVNTDGSISLKEAINSGAYLCKKKTGHGAPSTVRNYIGMLVSDAGPFKINQNENKKKVIVKRTDELTNQNYTKNDNFYDNLGMKK